MCTGVNSCLKNNTYRHLSEKESEIYSEMYTNMIYFLEYSCCNSIELIVL